MPRSPSVSAPEQTSSLTHLRGHLAAWCSGHAHPEESTPSKISGVENKATVSRGDQGEVTGPGRRGRAFLQFPLPRVVSATGVRGTLACLRGSLQSWPGSWDQVGHPHLEGLWTLCRASGQSTAHRCDPGGKPGNSGPAGLSSASLPGGRAWRRKTAMELRSSVSFSSCWARRWRPMSGPAGGWTDAQKGGKHHWPSESGIETDGRGEQYYHSKDPMGAIQQIPY